MSILSEEQAQEIFKSEHCNISKDLAGILYRAIEAAVLEAQGKQEPVAWMHWYKYYDGTDVVKVAIGHAPTFNDQSPFRSEPLFAAPVVQPGMVMVPREPTRAMLDAAHTDLVRDGPIDEMLRLCYRAMIAAAAKDSPKAVQPDDLKDAARYRWLRDQCKDVDIRAGLGWIGQQTGIDAAIDAAMGNGQS